VLTAPLGLVDWLWLGCSRMQGFPASPRSIEETCGGAGVANGNSKCRESKKVVCQHQRVAQNETQERPSRDRMVNQGKDGSRYFALQKYADFILSARMDPSNLESLALPTSLEVLNERASSKEQTHDFLLAISSSLCVLNK